MNPIDAYSFPLLYSGALRHDWLAAVGVFTAEVVIWVFPLWVLVMA